MSRAPAAPEAANHRARRPRFTAPRRDLGRAPRRTAPCPGVGPLQRAGWAGKAAGEGGCGGGAPRGLLHGAAWFPERRLRVTHIGGSCLGTGRGWKPGRLFPYLLMEAGGQPGPFVHPPDPQARRAWGHHGGSASPKQGSAGMSSTSPHAHSSPNPIVPARSRLAPCLGCAPLTSRTPTPGITATSSQCPVCGGAPAT